MTIITNILDFFEASKKDAKSALIWDSHSDQCGNPYKSFQCMEAPIFLDPVKIKIPSFPFLDEGEIIADKIQLMKYISGLIKSEINLKGFNLEIGFQIIQDYGSELKKKPHEILIINGTWTD